MSDQQRAVAERSAGVVIPAHDEGRVLARTLRALADGIDPGVLDVVVVCNGCTDDTAAVARAAAPWARVLEVPVASKSAAVAIGNRATDVFPRVHLDADVELSGRDLLALVEPLVDGRALASAPRRVLATSDSAWAVRAYYGVWELLPQVRGGLFGRGVFALSEEGQRRVDAQPRLMSDDLGASEAFAPGERLVVDEAVVTVTAPRSLRDLVRRRVRVVTGNAQAARLQVRRPGSTTSVRTLAALAVEHPGRAPGLAVFAAVTVVARLRARPAVRRGDFTTWLRDESSRA